MLPASQPYRISPSVQSRGCRSCSCAAIPKCGIVLFGPSGCIRRQLAARGNSGRDKSWRPRAAICLSASDADDSPPQPPASIKYRRVPVARASTSPEIGRDADLPVRDVPLADIRRPFKAARANDASKVTDLASSIKKIGLQVPVNEAFEKRFLRTGSAVLTQLVWGSLLSAARFSPCLTSIRGISLITR